MSHACSVIHGVRFEFDEAGREFLRPLSDHALEDGRGGAGWKQNLSEFTPTVENGRNAAPESNDSTGVYISGV